MDKLKPCPFCGSDKIKIRGFGGFHKEGGMINCSNCGGRMATPYSLNHDVVSRWNHRHNAEAIVELIEAVDKWDSYDVADGWPARDNHLIREARAKLKEMGWDERI